VARINLLRLLLLRRRKVGRSLLISSITVAVVVVCFLGGENVAVPVAGCAVVGGSRALRDGQVAVAVGVAGGGGLLSKPAAVDGPVHQLSLYVRLRGMSSLFMERAASAF
jgi:hypothetical protein